MSNDKYITISDEKIEVALDKEKTKICAYYVRVIDTLFLCNFEVNGLLRDTYITFNAMGVYIL